MVFFFFQAEDGIRDRTVTGVQTCALPICAGGEADHDGGGATGNSRSSLRECGSDRKGGLLLAGGGRAFQGAIGDGRSDQADAESARSPLPAGGYPPAPAHRTRTSTRARWRADRRDRPCDRRDWTCLRAGAPSLRVVE